MYVSVVKVDGLHLSRSVDMHTWCLSVDRRSGGEECALDSPLERSIFGAGGDQIEECVSSPVMTEQCGYRIPAGEFRSSSDLEKELGDDMRGTGSEAQSRMRTSKRLTRFTWLVGASKGRANDRAHSRPSSSSTVQPTPLLPPAPP